MLLFIYLFSEQIWLVKNIKVCYLPPPNSTTSKTPPPVPQEPKNLGFFTRAASSVFHLSFARAQKAKASNDMSCKMERLLPTKQGREGRKRKMSNQTDTFWVMIDIAALLYYSCDVRPDSLFAQKPWPHTLADAAIWC